jgi:hypothetical protein
MQRREFLKKGFIGTSLIFIPGFGFMSCTKNSVEPTIDPIKFNFCSPVDQPAEMGGFYVQFINGEDYTPAELDVNTWRLRLIQTVNGNVIKEKYLTFEEISTKYQHLEESFFNTFQCVGNTPGGYQISNGYFSGVPLRIYLENELNIDWNSTNRIYFRCFDDYHTNHVKDRILNDNPTPAYLVYKFDGILLNERRRGTLQHGYPVRMVVQDMLGMKSPKSIMEIEVSDRDVVDGYWETRLVLPGVSDLTWADIPPIKVNSRIFSPVNYMKAKKGRTIVVSGIAFGGINPVEKVEIGIAKVEKRNQIAEPINWQLAEIQGQPDSSAKPVFDDSSGDAFNDALTRLGQQSWPAPFVWCEWKINLQVPNQTGDYGLFVRATDTAQNVQPFTETKAEELQDGNNASHSLILQVE